MMPSIEERLTQILKNLHASNPDCTVMNLGMTVNEAKKLNGMTPEDLRVLFGDADSEYPYKGEIHRSYSFRGKPVVVQFVNGVVHKAMPVDERRESIRTIPSGIRIAHIRIDGQGFISGHILDMSAKSIAFKVNESQPMPPKGSKVSFCTNLKVKRFARAYIRLRGEVYCGEGGRLVVILDRSVVTLSYKTYVEYIDHKIAMKALEPVIVASETGKDSDIVTIIKSDLCFECVDKYCGIRETMEDAK